MRIPPYFILTGELGHRARTTIQINNNGHSVEIGQIRTISDNEIPYKGAGTLIFGIYAGNGRKTGVCLGRVYGAGVHEGKNYVVIHPHSEPQDTDVVAQYAETETLGLTGTTTLEELETSLQAV